jgi:hypothetical protein
LTKYGLVNKDGGIRQEYENGEGKISQSDLEGEESA